jgi:beta-galactosidase
MKSSTNKTSSHKLKVTGYSSVLLLACGLLLCGCASIKTKPEVYVKKLKHSRYKLMVKGKPYIVKGVCYNPVPIGQNHEYDWWSDPNKPWIVDGNLMQKMGINTVRIYQPSANPEKTRTVIRDLFDNYGIRVILGHWLGFWEYPCPFYDDSKFQERIKKEVLEMVRLYKDEPGLLLWILGNENNYSCMGTVNPWSSEEIDKERDPQKQKIMRAIIYYSYVNELARQMRQIDPRHPIALGNGELVGLDIANLVCPDIDLVACIIYRGKTFGNLFNSLKATFDRPVILSEFGADSYDAYLGKENQSMQAFFLESQWSQIYDNLAGNKKGAGNCLGGTIFEWTDEWWKHNPDDPQGWSVHDTGAGWSNGSYYFDIRAANNMNMNEEWFGIVALSPELENGINKRIPKKAYYVIREFWESFYDKIK